MQAQSEKNQSTTLNPKTTDSHAWISTEAVETRFGDFEFKNGYPTPAAADALLEQLRLNRAIEVYLPRSHRSPSLYFGIQVKQGAFGKFYHHREPVPIDNQFVVRANRDVLVSGAVFDLDAGPVTITLPDPGQRFMSMLAVDQDHDNPKTQPSCSAEE